MNNDNWKPNWDAKLVYYFFLSKKGTSSYSESVMFASCHAYLTQMKKVNYN